MCSSNFQVGHEETVNRIFTDKAVTFPFRLDTDEGSHDEAPDNLFAIAAATESATNQGNRYSARNSK